MAVEEEIAELRRVAGASTDSELASLMNLQRSAISQWRKRGKVPDRARRSVEKLAANQDAQKRFRADLESLPVNQRQLARALAILYHDPGPLPDTAAGFTALARELKIAALYFEETERAAAILLRYRMALDGSDPEAAYLALLRSSSLNQDILTAIMMPSTFATA